MNRYFRGVIRGVVPRTGQKWVKPGRSRSGPPALVRVSGVSGRVLVVDDNKVIRQLIRVNLELEGGYLDKGKRKRKEKAGSLQWAYMAIARLGGFMDSKRTGIASWGALW